MKSSGQISMRAGLFAPLFFTFSLSPADSGSLAFLEFIVSEIIKGVSHVSSSLRILVFCFL